MWMHLQSRPPGRELLSEPTLSESTLRTKESHLQHTQDKQHVWFLTEKIKLNEITINDDDGCWSLYTFVEPSCGHFVSVNTNLMFPLLPLQISVVLDAGGA